MQLRQIGGPLAFTIGAGRRLVLGRSAGCDLVVAHPAVSRRHAELELGDEGLLVEDLASANGTQLNGARIGSGRAVPDDVIAFGSTAFRVLAPAAAVVDEVPAGTSVRSLADLAAVPDRRRETRILARLLEVSAGLTGDFPLDRLLETVTELCFAEVEADRVVLLRPEAGSGRLVPAAARSREGDPMPQVPRAIADRAVADRVPIVMTGAATDDRFRSASVRLLAVRSALCVPLLAADRVLGVLYADTITRPTPFGDAEARALHAFAGLAAVAIARVEFAEEARQERDRRARFERFFAPSVAAHIAALSEPAILRGTRCCVAVLFCDIRDFTAHTASMPPEETAALLRDYFQIMVDLVFEHGGTLDKFIGDAVMAVWGAPAPQEDAADRAYGAGRAMLEELGLLNRRRRERGLPAIEAGVGLGYGEVFAGNIGGPTRLDYTVIGDAVNIAARLSDLAGPGEVLASEAFVARLAQRPPCRLVPADSERVAGPAYRLGEGEPGGSGNR